MMLEDEPLRLEGVQHATEGGQVQVAPELMKWLGQSRKDTQLWKHEEVKGNSNVAKKNTA